MPRSVFIKSEIPTVFHKEATLRKESRGPEHIWGSNLHVL